MDRDAVSRVGISQMASLGMKPLPGLMRSLLSLWMVLGCLAGAVHAGVCTEREAMDSQASVLWPHLAEARIAGVFDKPVRLSKGQFVGPPYVSGGHSRPTLRLWPEILAKGDLDGRAGEEIAGLASETSGGSGERVYIIVAKATDAPTAILSAQLVGDRVKIRGMQIKDGFIVLDLIKAGDREPLCCGTTLTQSLWTLGPNGPRLAEKRPQGRLSLKVIEGETWFLVGHNKQVKEDKMDQWLVYECTSLTVRDGRITGDSGSSRYTGQIVETRPGRIVISQLVVSAPRGGEQYTTALSSYLSLLSSVTRYTFLASRLTLVSLRANRPVLLKFARTNVKSP